MTSWRDNASEQTQADMQAMLDAALPFAQEMVARRGEFFPYGYTMDHAGEIGALAVDTGDDHPPSQVVLDALVNSVRPAADRLRAVALVSDVLIDGNDAIRVEVEHRDGIALAVLQPYRKKRLGRGVEYGNLSALTGERRIWT